VDEAAARAVDVGDEQEGDRQDKRQDEEKRALTLWVFEVVAEQDVAADGDERHQAPGGEGDAVPPGGLGVALRVEHIVHAGDGEADDGGRLRGGGGADGGPEVGLELRGVGVDVVETASTGLIEEDALIKVFAEEGTDLRGGVGGEEVGAEVLGADGVGFGLLVVFPLVVTADGHGEAEADDEAEEGEGSSEDDAEVFAIIFFQATLTIVKPSSHACGGPQYQDGEQEEQDWLVGGSHFPIFSPSDCYLLPRFKDS